MAIHTDHIIRKQILDIECESKNEAWNIQNQLRDFYYEKLLPELNDIFSQSEYGGLVYKIDNLTLDLGEITLSDLDSGLIEKFKAEVATKLSQLLHDDKLNRPNSVSSTVQKIPYAKNDWELLFSFLKTGLLPWTGTRYVLHDLENIIRRKIENNQTELNAKLSLWFRSPGIVNRMVNQFKTELIHQLVWVTLTNSTDGNKKQFSKTEFSRFMKGYTSRLGIMGRVEKKILSDVIKKTAEKKVAENRKQISFIVDLVESMHSITAIDLEKIYLSFIKQNTSTPFFSIHDEAVVIHELKQSSGSKLSEKQLGRILKLICKEDMPLEKLHTLYTKKRRELEMKGSIIASQKLKSGKNKTSEIERNKTTSDDQNTDDLKWNSRRNTFESHVSGEEMNPDLSTTATPNLNDSKKTGKEGVVKEKEKHKISNVQKSGKKNASNKVTKINLTGSDNSVDKENSPLEFAHEPVNTESKPFHPLSEEALNAETPLKHFTDYHESEEIKRNVQHSSSKIEEIFIGNAGLVILWSFIPHYFKHLGLINPTGFVNENSRHRAVHLLHYLCFANHEIPEYETGLNKLLCGMEIAEVLETGFEITKEETDEAENLLKAVVSHWSVLGNTSNNGLRQSFLCRNGILTRKEKTWILQVEKSGIDILVEKLPWSISLVKLSWMKESIQVEWT